jgi:hypothetical protein
MTKRVSEAAAAAPKEGTGEREGGGGAKLMAAAALARGRGWGRRQGRFGGRRCAFTPSTQNALEANATSGADASFKRAEAQRRPAARDRTVPPVSARRAPKTRGGMRPGPAAELGGDEGAEGAAALDPCGVVAAAGAGQGGDSTARSRGGLEELRQGARGGGADVEEPKGRAVGAERAAEGADTTEEGGG